MTQNAAEDMGPEVLIERRGDIAIVWLNRERESNAIGWSLGKNLLVAFDQLEDDESINAIVLSGKGKAFCAGAKLGEVVRLDGVDPDEQYRGFRDIVKAVSRIRNLEIPVICAVNGAAVGGGAAIAMACDLVVASERAYYLFAFGRMGASTADMGCSYLLPRIVGAARARHLLLTGARVSAAQGKDYGLFLDVVAEDALLETALALARQVIESAPRRALAASKQVILRGETTDFETCLFYERYLQTYFLNSDEHKSRLRSFLSAKADAAGRR